MGASSATGKGTGSAVTPIRALDMMLKVNNSDGLPAFSYSGTTVSLDTGSSGGSGNTVRNGSGSPSSSLGENGDFYIDTDAWEIYGPKSSGSWGSGTSLIGADGTNGADGADGADGGSKTITSIKASNYTASTSELVRCDPSGGSFTITLPTAVGDSGGEVIVKNVTNSTNSITVDTTSSQTIDGTTTKILNTAYASVTIVSDGTNWMIV